VIVIDLPSFGELAEDHRLRGSLRRNDRDGEFGLASSVAADRRQREGLARRQEENAQQYCQDGLQSVTVAEAPQERRRYAADTHRQSERHSGSDSDAMGKIFLSQYDQHARRHENEDGKREQKPHRQVGIGGPNEQSQEKRGARETE